ncbi:MAG: hypothetical protein P8Z39_02650 [Gammaproteobacteria bacterium]
MKRLIVLLSVLALVFTSQAYAGKATRAAVLGFIGGFAVGKLTNKPSPPRTEVRYIRQRSQSPLEQAFRSQSRFIRRQIQARLQEHGYYRSYIDGIWGRGTRSALEQYALDSGKTHLLTTYGGSNELISTILSPEESSQMVSLEVGESAAGDTADVADESANSGAANAVSLAELKRQYGLADQQLSLLKAIQRVEEKEDQQNSFNQSKLQAVKARIDAIEGFKQQVASAAQTNYKESLMPSGLNMGMSAAKVSRIVPKVPYFIPGTNEFGEMRISPRVTDEGVMVYDLNFMDMDAADEKVRDTISIQRENRPELMFGIGKVYEWSHLAQQKGLHQRHQKSAVCFPKDMCKEKKVGNSSTEVEDST